MTYKRQTLINIQKIIDTINDKLWYEVGSYVDCDMCFLYNQQGNPGDSCNGCFAVNRHGHPDCHNFFVYSQLLDFQSNPIVCKEIITTLKEIKSILSRLPAKRFVPRTSGYFPELEKYRLNLCIK